MKKLFYFLSLVLLFSCSEQASEEGDVFYQEGDYEQAIRLYSSYLEINPGDVKTLFNRGRAYEEMELHELAYKDFLAVLEEDSEHLYANLSVGSYYYRKQDYQEATHFFDRAIKYHKQSAQAHFLSARAYHKQGMIDEAMKGYNQAISFKGDYGDAYLYQIIKKPRR
jgi:tetratricopeptide (TPR) repeat protein